MFITPIQLSTPDIKTKISKRFQYNSVDKDLKRDTIYFSGKVGGYLNKNLYEQSTVFKRELINLLMGDKSVEDNLKHLIHYIFPDFIFELKDIKAVKYPDVINSINSKNPMIIFSETNFDPWEIKTSLFINFDRINKIRENTGGNQKQLMKYASEIEKCIYRKNELNLISNIVDEFEVKLTQTQDINPKSVDQIIKNLANKYKLDLNYEVVNEKLATDVGSAPYFHSNRSSSGKISSNFAIDFDKNIKSLTRETSHEFTHLLTENSVEFNSTSFKEGDVNEMLVDFEEEFCKIYNQNIHFLKYQMEIKRKKYDGILSSIFKRNPDKNRKQLIELIENYAKDETLAYCKTPSIIALYENPLEPPIGFFYKDFLDYVMSVKYDSSKLAAIA